MALTDSHAHLSQVAGHLGPAAFGELLADYAAAAEAAAREGRTPPLLLDAGTEPEDLAARAGLLDPVARRSFLRLSAGLWPSAESLAFPARSLDHLERAIDEAAAAGVAVAAIGEGGLDYHHMEGAREAQAELFEGQLALASRRGLPMIVHSRDAFADSLELIAAARPGPGPIAASPVIIHCFGYGPVEAKAFLDAGCFLSFAGNLTYKGSSALREACALVPADRLLLETDAPYMNPMPSRGRPASPLDVARTYEAAASLRGESLAGLAETVSRNARALFGQRGGPGKGLAAERS